MNHSTYFGNFKDQIDCDALIKTLINQEGQLRSSDTPYGNSVELDEELLQKKHEMRDMWEQAGYLGADCVEWINYYPGTHFSTNIVTMFSDLVNADPYNIWISSTLPGKCVPWHWDIIKEYQTYRNDSRMVRYSFFIEEPAIGKIFILKDDAFHMIPKGDVYKWNKWDEWHLGFNCGLTQKFMFHFIGFDRG